jgi:uncharacterized protein (TIGR02996 family)
MNEGEALLAAILAAPDDDTPRLVYADWLDEHDQPERAEFIRVQIALAHGSTLALRAREKVLLALYKAEWLAPLKTAGEPLHGTAHGQFRRGFVEIVWMTALEFVIQAEALFARIPVRELRATKTLSVGFRALLRCPLLARLTGLDFSDRLFGDRDVWELASSTNVGALRILRLRGCRITDTGALRLAQVKFDCPLRELDVSHNPITTVGLDALRKRYGDAVIAEGMSSDA